ncbi:MAG: hypothetical protein HOP15_04475 [Planctomycetes bacterium]|nr:hypothetical protein [Planctomycetota bacterium]
MNSRTMRLSALAILALVLLAATAVSCRSTVTNRVPLQQPFPTVRGRSLAGEEVRLPVVGEPILLLVGYAQGAQFDADRWLFGLLQAGIPLRVIELPTIPGLFPRVISGTIDSGMQSGIPSEDWASVVPVYGSPARTIVEFTGNEQPRNIRVLLLDQEGRVHWFHDRGFSASKLLELDRSVRTLLGGS